MKPPTSTRLLSIDFVRVYVVLMVVIVHIITQPGLYLQALPGALLILLHVSREIFFIITGLVLTYTTKHKPLHPWRFWWRRYPAVVIPFVTWTLIYMAVGGQFMQPVGAFLNSLTSNLITGNASYQLYFLLVTMQLYAVFPLVRWLLRVTQNYHLWLLALSAALQVLFSIVIHYGWQLLPIFSSWFNKPDPWLLSYQFYLLAGCMAGWHIMDLTAWVRSHYRPITGLTVAAAILGLGVYIWQLAEGTSVFQATAVFQPVVVVESIAFALGLFALGTRWADRGSPHKRTFLLLSDLSFGIYLCHVLVLDWISDLIASSGLLTVIEHLPVPITLLLFLAIITPITYLASIAVIATARRTPLSLMLTGRARAKRVADEIKPITVLKTPV